MCVFYPASVDPEHPQLCCVMYVVPPCVNLSGLNLKFSKRCAKNMVPLVKNVGLPYK